MNIVAELQAAIINFATTVAVLGLAVIVLGVLFVGAYLVIRNSMTP